MKYSEYMKSDVWREVLGYPADADAKKVLAVIAEAEKIRVAA